MTKSATSNRLLVAFTLQLTCPAKGELGRAYPALFWKSKKVSWFLGGKALIHLWVKFSIKNVILRVSRRKKSKTFPCSCSAFFLVFLTKCLSGYPNSTKPPLPWKISSCAPALLTLHGLPSLLITNVWIPSLIYSVRVYISLHFLPIVKGNSKFEILLVRIFSLKQKNKWNSSSCYRKK